MSLFLKGRVQDLAKLNSQNFTIESFQDQKSWIGKLFSPLNSFISQVYYAFQNQLTVGDNLYQEAKTLTVVNETSNFPINFATKFNKRPEFVFIGTCIDEDGGYPSVAPLLQWDFANGILSIDSISGLTASKKYTLKLLIIYG